MLKGKIIDKALREGIETDRSRCLRMRFDGNSCVKCLEQCRSEAIAIDEDVRVNADNCSGCMLCVSACPSDCFRIKGLDFYSMIGRLREIGRSVPSPVLGCNTRTASPCHARTFCFGFLAEEHLLALSVFLRNPLQLDTGGCADCGNAFIVDVLEKRIEAARARTSINISGKIRLVKNEASLDFQEISCDRRGFFKSLKKSTLLQASALFDKEDEAGGGKAYSAKRAPFKRELLNRTLKPLSGEARALTLRTSYYKANVSAACNDCFACVGMCPAGALKTEETEEGRRLFFGSFLCSGCGLCAEFCMEKALAVKKGFSGDDPCEFYDTRHAAFCKV